MKIPVIKQLVENHTIEQLNEAENAILEEAKPPFEVQGDDEGEQLTHILAAVFIRHRMDHGGLNFQTALREYTQRVRTSIS